MRKIGLICIGKVKNDFWRGACLHYLRQLQNWCQIRHVELKDANLPIQERIQMEGKRILQALEPGDYCIAVDERGKMLPSVQFAHLLRNCEEKILKRPTFIVGGPYGLAADVLARSDIVLALSPMTFPHELARVLLLEQLYRAENILRGTPYHH